MAKLLVIQGAEKGTEVPIDQTTVVVGRTRQCALYISDPKSSRQHCEIFRKGRHLFLKDLGSRNGTTLNGKKFAGLRLIEVGDRIGIGDTAIEVMDEAVGRPVDVKIPGYELTEVIGCGGMGTVYKAVQLSMDRVVAVKVLQERYTRDSAFIQRFLNEARMAGKLNHPNLIHVHDVGEANGRYFFSMEYVTGPSLKIQLKRKGRLPVPQVLKIARQTAEALAFAHENQIIHRDIKPGNLMLTGEGDVKIADLGIAKTFEESREGENKKRIFGTPHYMAPEQALGKPLNPAVDIYSLGATIYHLLTGETPFAADTATDVVRAHLTGELAPIHTYAAEVPDPVVFLVERMMAKRVENRYPDMRSVATDIDRIEKDIAAEIARLPAGESSIMRALPKDIRRPTRVSAAMKRAWSGIGEAPIAVRVGIALALLILLAAVAVVTYLLVRHFMGTAPSPSISQAPPSAMRLAQPTDTARPRVPYC